MRYIRRKDPFCAFYDHVPVPETGYNCPVCCRDIVWWEEEWVWKDGEMVHKKCIEEENE